MTREEVIKELQESHDMMRSYNIDSSESRLMTALNMAIKALEQRPCEDAISRQAVQDYIAKYLSQYLYNDVREAVEVIDEYIGELPPVTPQPKTGHWIVHPEIETSTPEYLMFYECSECGDKQCFCKSDIHKKRFCGNCGCRMEEPQERSDKE